MFVAADLTYVSLLGAVACAEPGASSAKLLSQADDASTLSPVAITVLVGPNDRFGERWRESLSLNLKQLIAIERFGGRTVYLLTYPFGALLRPRWLIDLNTIIREVGREETVQVIDLEQYLRNDFASFLLDDVHPSPRGHERIAWILRQTICPLSMDPAPCIPMREGAPARSH